MGGGPAGTEAAKAEFSISCKGLLRGDRPKSCYGKRGYHDPQHGRGIFPNNCFPNKTDFREISP
jgi:hypothetical protein